MLIRVLRFLFKGPRAKRRSTSAVPPHIRPATRAPVRQPSDRPPSSSPTPAGRRIEIGAAYAAAEVLRGRCWVVDGDTVDICGRRIRLAGIDAPELDHPYGRNAKWAMVRLCKGQIVTATLIEEDTHGRTVAICTLDDGRDLARELVKQGLAVDWPKYSGGRYSDDEVPGIRKKLWRCDARQKGRLKI